jgi:hypothetical protein
MVSVSRFLERLGDLVAHVCSRDRCDRPHGGGCIAKTMGTMTHIHRHDCWSVVYGHVGDMSTLISEARGWGEAGGPFLSNVGDCKV